MVATLRGPQLGQLICNVLLRADRVLAADGPRDSRGSLRDFIRDIDSNFVQDLVHDLVALLLVVRIGQNVVHCVVDWKGRKEEEQEIKSVVIRNVFRSSLISSVISIFMFAAWKSRRFFPIAWGFMILFMSPIVLDVVAMASDRATLEVIALFWKPMLVIWKKKSGKGFPDESQSNPQLNHRTSSPCCLPHTSWSFASAVGSAALLIRHILPYSLRLPVS